MLALSDAQVLKVLAMIAAEALTAGSGLAERVGEWLQLDMRAFWQPDDTFVDLLTDKEALTRLAAEVGAAPSGQATGTELRGLIRRRLKGEGCPPVENWLPRYFEFPTQGYTTRPVSEARTAYDRLARCESSVTLEAEAEAEATAGWVEDADEAGIEWEVAGGSRPALFQHSRLRWLTAVWDAGCGVVSASTKGFRRRDRGAVRM